MTLELKTALVISGDQAGAKKALQDTAAGLEAVKTAATQASAAVAQLADPQQLAKLSTRELNTYLRDNIADPNARTDVKAQVFAQRRADLAALETAAATTEQSMADVGTAIDAAGGKFSGFKQLALGAFGGIAGALGVGLVETAIGTANAALGVFVNKFVSADQQIQAAIKAQGVLIANVKGAFAEGNGAASSYGDNSFSLNRIEAQQQLTELEAASQRAQADLLSGGLFHSNAIQAGNGPADSPLAKFVADLRAALATGKADVIAFRNEIARQTEGMAENDPSKKFGLAILADTKQAAEAEAAAKRQLDIYSGLHGAADLTATALGGVAEKYKLTGEAAATANPALAEYYRLTALGAGTPSVAATPGLPAPATSTGLLGNDIGSGALGGFAAGGWTGGGPAAQIAGFVHGQEYVFDAQTTQRIGVSNLDAMRAGVRGYASGGFVGTPTAGATGAYNVAAGLAQDFQQLSGAISDFVKQLWQTRDPLAALGSVIASVSQNFLSSAIGAVGNAAGNWVSGLISSAFGGGGAQLQLGYQAGVGHGGATIGASASRRLVPLSLFAGAPRHHTGTAALKAGEVPFIGMQGEEIGWPNDLARKYGGGGVTNFYISTPTPRAFAESQASVARSAGQLMNRVGRYS